mmetsp:Transcript_30575/g.70468  ORF Transcript_30575/g.70468 Transcript_30575/m.70468 type:complete len:211 (+) Transcript_30575:101-733(+)
MEPGTNATLSGASRSNEGPELSDTNIGTGTPEETRSTDNEQQNVQTRDGNPEGDAQLRLFLERLFSGKSLDPNNGTRITNGMATAVAAAPSNMNCCHSMDPNHRDLSRIQLHDVLCDRNDKMAPVHYGNHRFALLVTACIMRCNDDLHVAENRKRVAWIIIQVVRNCNPGGRFLAKTKYGTWKDIGDKLAIRWVGLILKKSIGGGPQAGK